jgi:hypothetical protein
MNIRATHSRKPAKHAIGIYPNPTVDLALSEEEV